MISGNFLWSMYVCHNAFINPLCLWQFHQTSSGTIANTTCSANTTGLSNGSMTELSEGRLASFIDSEFPSSVLVSVVIGASDSVLTGCN